jgi:DNA adenine methylase
LGNKQRYLKHLAPLLPKKYNRYIEPFLGSGSLFLHLQPTLWIINDLNKDLFDVWNLVKNEPLNIIQHFQSFARRFKPRSRDSKRQYCKEITDLLNDREFGKERTMDFLLMMQCCYMGVLKKKGRFYFYGMDPHIYMENKCFFLTPKYYQNIIQVSEFLNQSSKNKIMNTDYKKILQKAQKDDFVFLDPPYIEEDQDYNFEYNTDENLDCHFLIQLLQEVQKLDQKGVKWMMTQADTSTIRHLFGDYPIKEFPVFRSRSKTHKNELIIRNYLDS